MSSSWKRRRRFQPTIDSCVMKRICAILVAVFNSTCAAKAPASCCAASKVGVRQRAQRSQVTITAVIAMTQTPCVLSVSEHAGWAHVVAVAARDDVPAVVSRRRVTTIDPGLPTQPYHHEAVGMRDEDADALVARVRRSIAERSFAALERVVEELAPSHRVIALAIRKPPFADLPGTYAPVRESYALRCAADGMMYQIAVCLAARRLDLDVHVWRRGEEAARAAERLGVTPRSIESFVIRSGRPPGPPWTASLVPRKSRALRDRASRTPPRGA